MYVYLSKYLPFLVLPVGVVLELSLLALLCLWTDRSRAAVILLASAALLLYVSSMPLVGDYLLGRLESRHPAIALDAVPQSDCVVVLGGAVEPLRPPRVDVEMKDAVDRVYKAANLVRAGKARLVLVAAGNQPWAGSGQTEAEAIRALLLNWGVPLSAIRLDDASRNTRENALNTQALMVKSACGRSLLVTSAYHMERALATFSKVGAKLYPVPVDVRVARRDGLTLLDFLPDAQALANTSQALREWIGLRVYAFRGWN